MAAASPKASNADALASADAFVWHPDRRLAPVPRVSRVDLSLLKGIDGMRDSLIGTTERFALGLPRNNALWGARHGQKPHEGCPCNVNAGKARRPAGS